MRLNRVFFHELGHYVAQELNRQFYNGTGVRSVTIFPCEQNNNELCGGTQPHFPEGHNPNDKKPPPIERLAQYLASVIHGCMFQCYHDKSNIDECFRTYGNNDTDYWLSALKSHKMGEANKDFARIDAAYFRQLLDTHALDGFMQLVPQNYLVVGEPNHYDVNLERLSEDTNCLIAEYANIYRQLIENYSTLVRKCILAQNDNNSQS